jgi:pyruvate dehydrogenase E1 component
MPEGAAEGIVRGIYKLKPAASGEAAVQLFGSGPILNEVLRAQTILDEKYKIQADVWSVPSYTEVRREALAVERWNRLHPAEPAKKSYVQTLLDGTKGPIVAASDYMKSVPDGLAPWLGTRLATLGTDGFGRSDNREHLRRHFEVSAEAIVGATLSRLVRDGAFSGQDALAAFEELGLDVEAKDPARA